MSKQLFSLSHAARDLATSMFTFEWPNTISAIKEPTPLPLRHLSLIESSAQLVAHQEHSGEHPKLSMATQWATSAREFSTLNYHFCVTEEF